MGEVRMRVDKERKMVERYRERGMEMIRTTKEDGVDDDAYILEEAWCLVVE